MGEVESPFRGNFSVMSRNDRSGGQSEQRIDVPLPVGSRVVLLEDAEVELVDGEVVGATSSPYFEDWVDQYVPETGLLRFEESDVGRAEFLSMLDEADGFLVVNEEEERHL